MSVGCNRECNGGCNRVWYRVATNSSSRCWRTDWIPCRLPILQVSGWPRSKVWPNVNLSRVLICVRYQRCEDAKFCDLYG